MYTVNRTVEEPGMAGDWDGEVWKQAETLEVAHDYVLSPVVKNQAKVK